MTTPEDAAKVASWDQAHAAAVDWLYGSVDAMRRPVAENGAAESAWHLWKEFEGAPHEALRKGLALAITELARMERV